MTAGSAKDDYRSVARLHESLLEAGLLALLGTSFLSGFYRYLASSSDAFLFAAVQDKDVIGFVSGAIDTKSFYRTFVMKRGIQTVVGHLAFRVANPSVLRRIVSIRRHMVGGSATNNLPKAELLSLAVRPDMQRGGVGHALFARLCNEFAERHVDRFKVVGEARNEASMSFYRAHGGTPAGVTDLGGLECNLYEFSVGAR
jgi:ribosomal protein S18 acetylase RimI-like enzyme